MYFSLFPKVKYDNKIVTNITLRTKILDGIGKNPYVYLPYTVEEGERAQDVAYYYYGDPQMDWLVYFSNDIIDPYRQWPMDQDVFVNYLKKTYKDKAAADGFTDVYAWTMSEAVTSNIITVVNVDDEELQISYDTYLLDPNIVAADWRLVRVFEYENEQNENKRQIRLLNEVYANIAADNLKRLLNE